MRTAESASLDDRQDSPETAVRTLVAMLAVLLVALAPAGAAATQADVAAAGDARLERVVVQLKWRHQFQFAGYYAAIARGYYRDAGLAVALREPGEGEDPVEAVVSGQAQYGVGGSELLLARAAGAPVVALAAIYQHSPYALVTLRESGIGSVHDLAGRRVMIEPQAAELLAYLRYEGIDASQIEQVEHGFDIAALAEGRVDAMTAYVTDEVFALEQAGLRYQLFSARAAGIDFYGDVLFTTEAEVEQRPERLRAFLDATLAGWRYALDHPEEIARLIRSDYSERHSLEHLLFEAERSRRLMRDDVVEIGYMHAGRWRHIAETYAELGMLPGGAELDAFLFRPDAPDGLASLYRLVALFSLALAAAGGLGAWFWVLSRRLRREVAEREAAQWRAEAALARERSLLSILAHDFGTPLNVISAAAQLLDRHLDGDDRTRARGEVERIRTATQLLGEQIAACLGRGREVRPDGGPVRPLELRRLLDQLLKERRSLVPERSFLLEVESEEAGTAPIEGDEVLLAAAFANLIDNAIKYSTPRGAVRVRLALAGRNAVVEVLDEGPGIAEPEAERIFEKYYRAPQTQSAGGIGLGLFMVRSVVESHGGTVVAVHGPEGRFRVTLPLLGAPASGTAAPRAA